jgi:hypothetical protein
MRAPHRALRLEDGTPSGYARTTGRVPRVAGEAPTTLGYVTERLRRKNPAGVTAFGEGFNASPYRTMRLRLKTGGRFRRNGRIASLNPRRMADTPSGCDRIMRH